MSVIDVRERHDERRATIKNGQRTYSHTYLVRTTDINDGQSLVLSASGVPSYNMPYPGDPSALALSIECEPHESTGKHWLVRVDFSAPEGEEYTQNPLDRPADFSYGDSSFGEHISSTVVFRSVSHWLTRPPIRSSRPASEPARTDDHDDPQ